MTYLANDFKTMRLARIAEKEKRIAAFRKRIIFSSLILFIIFISGFFITTYADANNTKIIEYQVETGDTLWKIAKEHNQSNKDIREYIYNIQKINNLETGLVMSGQIIKIPVYSNY